MSASLIAYLIAVLLFVVIDMIWLMGPGRPIYVAEIGTLLRSQPSLPAAIAFYLLYGAGLVFFAVNGAVATGNPSQALVYGAVLGLVAYGTYDLTNLAVINGFTLKIALIDMVWGSLLSGAVAWISTRLLIAFG